MNYAELIEKLHKLPEAKQSTVFDFDDFLVERNESLQQKNKTLAKSPLADMMKNPLLVHGFTPMSREECNVRLVKTRPAHNSDES